MKKELITGEGDPDAVFPIPFESEFDQADKDPDSLGNEDFLPSIELMQIGQALIENRECFDELRKCQIAFLWKREGGKSSGNATLGKCIRVKSLARLYSKVDFVIWLARDHCAALHFTYWQIEALLFHELKHAGADTDIDLSIKKVFTIPHDWEGFVDEIKYYGLWTPDLTPLHSAFTQLKLDLFNEPVADDDTKVTLSTKGPDGTEVIAETTAGNLSRAAAQMRAGRHKQRGPQ